MQEIIDNYLHIIHQMQRGKFCHHRPEMDRQQRETDADNLPTPVAGLLLRHAEVTHGNAIFLQYLPAQAKHQPENRQFFTERP